MKTGRLIIAFPARPARSWARPRTAARHALHAYAQDLGLAFQIADDLLDVEGERRPRSARRCGKDADAGKATFVSLLGVDRAPRAVARIAWPPQAVAHLELFRRKGDFCGHVARFVVDHGEPEGRRRRL